MVKKIAAIFLKPIVLAPLLKGVAYSSTTAAICCPKLSWLFGAIAAIAGASFYLFLGAAAFDPIRERFGRLGRGCKVGDNDEDGQLITRQDWF
ncbi:MAG: hypothetical protein ABH810_01395 [bacterium]